MPWQHTLQHKFTVHGIGLHSGCRVQCELLPQPPGTGVVFVRTDIPGQPQIAASVFNVHATTLATTLGARHQGNTVTVSTVEHLMAALYALGVDNVRVLIDGPEVPVMDGSAEPWVQHIRQAGLEASGVARTYLRLRREVRVAQGHKWASLQPHSHLRIQCAFNFDHPLIPQLPFCYDAATANFDLEVAPARTFCFRQEIDSLKAQKLARGGSLDNAIVIDGYKVLNTSGLRFVDECVRHKVLDAIGDLALLGAPVLGRLDSFCTGHALNTELVRAVLADPDNVERVALPQALTQTLGRKPVLQTLASLEVDLKGLV